MLFRSVTGGAKGIGFGSANQLLEAGFSVALFDIDEAGLAKAKSELANYRGQVITFKVDVANEKEIKEAIAKVATHFGQIDAVANCAGIQTYGTALDTTEELWDRTFDVNVKSMLWTSKYAIPYMKKDRKSTRLNSSHIPLSRMPSSA